MSSSANTSGNFNLLDLPLIGSFLRWKYSRMAMQSILLIIAVIMILHGLFGPQLAPRNLATLLTWVHYRGILVFLLLVGGNFFCMACPFMLPRELARKFSKPVRNWPRWLRNKWLSVVLFIAVLFSYELFDLWGSPWWTAWLIIAYFVSALLVDAFFKKASFCKYVCPIGQFNFISSTVSPLEVKVRDHDKCAECETLDCIKGTRDPENQWDVVQRGCELALFQPRKVGNMDCTFCLDCVYACPHDNVGISTRSPGEELWADERRSGIGRFSNRKDLSILALIFTFGALLNAFGMVSPVYAVQRWLADLMNTTSEVPVLGTLFFGLLVVEPAVLMGLAAYSLRELTKTDDSLVTIITGYAFALVPFGFGLWVAHYSFHFLTELALCQRYYEKTFNTDDDPGTTGGGLFRRIYTTVSINHELLWQFKVVKRVVPTITIYSPSTGNTGVMFVDTADRAANTAFVNQSHASINLTAGLSASSPNQEVRAHITADAEL